MSGVIFCINVFECLHFALLCENALTDITFYGILNTKYVTPTTSCLLPWTMKPFQKFILRKEKLLLEGNIFFSVKANLYLKGRHN